MSTSGGSGDLLVRELSSGLGSGVSAVEVFTYGRGDVAAVLVQERVVEPADMLGGGELEFISGAP